MSRILTSTKDLPHDKWLEYRRTGIGGSDASTVVGLNPYSSLYKLYADKKGLISATEDTEVMRQGRDFEEYVAKRFTEATGKKVRRRNYMFQHDDYDYILADIDREIIGENAGLECKTTSVFNKSDFENGEIPLTYYVQMTHYMAVMGYDRMYLAVLILSKGFYWFVIERDEDEITALLQAESDFWNDYIIPEKMPPIDGSEATQETISEMYPDGADNETITISDNLMQKYKRLKELSADVDNQLNAVKSEIKTVLGDNIYGACNGYKVTWKTQNKTTVDTKKLKKEYPHIYEAVAKSSSSRVLRITEEKEQ
ncbi:MAG: YqaJ viral recombinase family protein [Acutalibacteraceae bacterium]|nr:YqaJ viral recombinase family protein [Acutalibacteraceae bacterium]